MLRQISIKIFLGCISVLLLPTLSPSHLLAQAALPTDAKELMRLAASSNSLVGDHIQPWHIRASFQIYDQKGHMEDQGSFEEFWVSPKKYKRVYESNKFSRTEFGTERGALRTGSRNTMPATFDLLRAELVSPIPADMLLVDHSTFAVDQRTIGDFSYQCLRLTSTESPDISSETYHSSYCLDAQIPMIRVSLHSGDISRVSRNNYVLFQGSYLPMDLLAYPNGNARQASNPVMTAHLESVEMLESIQESEFIAPANAAPVPIELSLPEFVTRELMIYHPAPTYPSQARAAKLLGTVVLQATIGADGRVVKLTAASGPTILQEASTETVKRWRFKPYLLDGRAVEFKTTVTITFSPAGEKHESESGSE
jgi:TonB family protein